MNFSEILKKYSKDKILQAFRKTAIEHKLAMAAWRLPDKGKLFIISGQALIFKEEEDFKPEDSGKGFCFFPFQKNSTTPGFFIQPDILLAFEGNDILILSEENHTFLYSLQEKLSQDNNAPTADEEINSSIKESSKERFKDMVSLARNRIREENTLKKVVLSRNLFMETPSDFSATDFFLKTSEVYPHAFAFLVSYNLCGTWMGATPETLVHISKDKIFKTVALAGTQSAEGKETGNAVWTQKEIEEQALVSRYIINCFKQIRLREFEEEGPSTVRAAGLLHLKTFFSVDLTKVEYKGLGNDMLKLLHPTSAVCGMPRDEAMDFILKEEGIERQYFSGFSGPINIDGEINIFVNLRCAKQEKDRIILFSGAGITRDSDLEKEWQETSLKIKTIGDLIK